MSEDVKPEVIKKTQDLLGKYFKKPPLTEKLLRKPPFRFLHDIITAIIKETGFLDGLFTEEEMISENIKDKDAKLSYLTKLIDVVKLITGANLTVRASKIISGQEPTKTNELLQMIGKCLNKKINSTEAIEHYKKNGDKKTRSTVKSKTSLKEQPIKKPLSRQSSQTRKSSEKEKTEHKKRSSSTSNVPPKEIKTNNENSKTKSRESSENDNEINKNQNVEIPPAEPVEERVSSSRRKRVPSTAKTKPEDVSSNISDSTISKTSSSPTHKVKRHSSESHHENKIKQQTLSDPPNESVISEDNETNVPLTTEKDAGDAKSNVSFKKESAKGSVEVEKASSRNKSARVSKSSNSSAAKQFASDNEPTPVDLTKVSKETQEASVPETIINIPRTSLRPPSARPMSARPAAPRTRTKSDFILTEDSPTPMGPVNVILESFDQKDDDADDMVVMEIGGNGDSLGVDTTSKMQKELTQEHGHLVAQILETQKELVNTDNLDVLPKKVEIEWEVGSRRDHEVVVKEIDKLRSEIQTLTRATNPLGKLLDYVQEDVETMQRELYESRNEYNQLMEQFEKEQIQTQESVGPMKDTLKSIENNIKMQLDKICQAKANIARNDQKIQRLLNGHV
ncbi:TRAF3-interacting protein 1 [Orussus abietinus]|uniref:TRAF3-interacting protein 1 n=1 Tax=Orussus abietinus TaxID=222816 RepID=UPI000626252B|nr:TRAF3-interacting protein 1 [Orussus abietinus]